MSSEIEQWVESMLNDKGRKLWASVSVLSFRIIVVAGLTFLIFRQLATPTIEEFRQYRDAQSSHWIEHEKRCEEIIVEWKVQTSEATKAVAELQRILMQMNIRRTESPRAMER